MSNRSEFEYRLSNLIPLTNLRRVPSKSKISQVKEAKSVGLNPIRNEHYYCSNCGANTASVKKR